MRVPIGAVNVTSTSPAFSQFSFASDPLVPRLPGPDYLPGPIYDPYLAVDPRCSCNQVWLPSAGCIPVDGGSALNNDPGPARLAVDPPVSPLSADQLAAAEAVRQCQWNFRMNLIRAAGGDLQKAAMAFNNPANATYAASVTAACNAGKTPPPIPATMFASVQPTPAPVPSASATFDISAWLQTTSIGSIPNWLLLAGAAGLALYFWSRK